VQVDNAFPGLLTQRIQRLLQVLFNMSGAIKLLVGGQTEQGAAPASHPATGKSDQATEKLESKLDLLILVTFEDGRLRRWRPDRGPT